MGVMETDTSGRVIQSGSLQYNQFPLCSSPRKKGANVVDEKQTKIKEKKTI